MWSVVVATTQVIELLRVVYLALLLFGGTFMIMMMYNSTIVAISLE